MISLSELARLDAARTSGEWDVAPTGWIMVYAGDATERIAHPERDPNARAIVAAINSLAPLLRAVRAARAQREAESAFEEFLNRTHRPGNEDDDDSRYTKLRDARHAARRELDAALKEVEP